MYTLKIYIPEDLDRIEFSDEVHASAVNALTHKYGGTTTYFGSGTYRNRYNVVCREAVKVVTVVLSAREHNYTVVREYATSLAKEIAHKLDQQSVLFTLTSDNGECFFVTQD